MKKLILFLALIGSFVQAWQCQRYEEVPGPEDIEISHSKGFALISSTSRRDFSQNGQIFFLDLNRVDSRVLPLLNSSEIKKIGIFKPHGISIVEDAGRTFVFVINHPVNTGADIEKFEFSGSRLVHLKTYKSPSFLNANDIVALNQNEFLLTADHNAKNLWTRVLQDLVIYPSGRVKYFNGNEVKTLQHKFIYSNGITLNPLRNRLYVSSTLGDVVDVFARQSSQEEWKHIQKFKVKGHADNLSWDSDGNLNIALQGSKWDFARHALDPNFLVSSRIAKLIVGKDGKIKSIKNIFEDKSGQTIAGASVGAAFRNELLVGAVFENHFLRCQKSEEN